MAVAPMIPEPRRNLRHLRPAPNRSQANRAFHDIETDPKKLRRLFSRDQLVADRILAASRAAWAAWNESQEYKKEHGYCISGLTCVRKAVGKDNRGKAACEHHISCAENGVELMAPRYRSEYGILRKFEMETER